MNYKVKITGVTPYMQHRMDDKKLEDWEKERHDVIENRNLNDPDKIRAEFHCYRNGSGKCFIPAEHIRGALINAGTYVKSKVGAQSKSMKTIVASMFMVSPAHIDLPDWQEVDKRSAVNRNVKARVIVIRPKWNDWSVTFDLNVLNDSISKEMVAKVLSYAGDYVGIGSYRPTANGMYGKFTAEILN